MGDRSKIEWTDSTWNPVTGCTEVSPGCDHCYARTLAHGKLKEVYGARLPVVDDAEHRADPFAVRTWPERLDQPMRWTRPRRVFVNSMSDWAHAEIPESFLDLVWAVMALTPRHTYQALTKRPARAARYLRGLREPAGRTRLAASGALMWRGRDPNDGFDGVLSAPWPLPNVWVGATVENQANTYRIRHLRECDVAVRFLSCEPLLEDLGPLDLAGIGWVIVGGESGPGFRPMDPDWARSIRDQCVAAGVAFHFKQWGGRTPKSGGRELDGRTWDEFPREAA